MRPSADHTLPHKRRRVDNRPTVPSPPSTQTNSFLNNTLILPQHPVSAPQQLPFNHSNHIPNPHSHITLPSNHSHPPNPQTIRFPFANPSASLQNSSIPSSNTLWTPHPNPSTAPEFSSANALDDFFTTQPNQSEPSTLENHHPILNPTLRNNPNFPALLPPLVSGKPPPLGPLGPLSTFPPSANTFPIPSPLHEAFLASGPLPNISASSPPVASPSFALQASSSAPTPAMRQRIGSRMQNGLASTHHHNTSTVNPGSSQFHTSRLLPPKPGINPMASNTTTRPTPISLGTIPPVKKALDLFRDDSPIMVALAQTILQTTNPSIPTSIQRRRIFDFSGFPLGKEPNYQSLLSLSKSDLDMLAWVFVVSKHGRKEEVARRIVASLRAPLQFRVPPQAKRPDIPTRADAGNALGTLAAVIRNAPQPNRTSTRTNMPALAPAPLHSPRGHTILSNLQRQLAPSGGQGTTALSSQSSGRLSSQANKSKQMQNLCSEVLNGYSFDVGENPFNRPMNPPLGQKPNVVFSSVQLSRGNNDPVLRFETPAPINKTVRREVEGGDVQVHIRCLRVEIEKSKSEWKQAWPFPATCRVNGHSIVLNQAQRYTNGKLAGRDAATNITPFLRKFKKSGVKEMNKIVLRRQSSTATAATGQYVFFAQEVLVLSRETMTKSVFEASEKYWVEHRTNLEKKGVITSATSRFEMARHGVMQFLTDPDGLTVSSMKVSLRCPLALTRIATPVKGKKCQHVQCFDLENFLEYARRSSKFDCPVCNKNTADPATLVISPYIEHALATFEDCDEVEINQDGSMVAVERKQSGVASDDDDDDDADVKSEPRKLPSRSRGAGTPGGPKTPEVVDLTLDSDDDCAAAANEDQQSEFIQPDTSSSVPLTGGGLLHAPGGSMGPGNQIESSSPLAQDMFSFTADFFWREPQISNNFGASATRLSQSQVDGVRDNRSADVIAIDSD